MKKNLFVTLLILIHILSFAQVQWQDNGVPVRQGDNIVWNQTSVACEDNTFVSIWTDTRNGTRGVYVQKVDGNGNSLWDEDGIEIYNPERMQSNPIALSSTDNTVIICWQDHDAIEVYSSQIRVQKIEASGNLLWGEEGVLLEESGANGGKPQMIKHSDGGVYIIWNETPQSDIKGIRLLADGSIAEGWGQGIELLPAMYEYDTYSDQMDGIILSASLYDDIYIQRVDENGNKLWGYNGTLLYNGNYYYNFSEMDICSSIIGEYYFSWQTYEQNSVHEIMIQKVDSTGNPIWDSPIIITEEYAFRFMTICPLDSQPIVTWIINETIFSQKIDSDGNLLWGEEGITVFESDEYVNDNTIILKEDIANGCILTWEDYRENDGNRILVQRINSSGDLLFEEDGLTIYENSNNYSFNPSLAIIDQQYYLCWLDNTDDSQSLIHQIIDGDGNIYLEENGEEIFTGLHGSVIDFRMLLNADNTIIIWSEKRNNNHYQIFLQILNSEGSNVFVENGIPITADANFYLYDFETVYGENSENIALVWSENRLGYRQIFAQSLDTSGNLLWADSTGICLTPVGYESYKPKISWINTTGNDEYYIGWEDFTDFFDSRIIGQKIVDGNLEWGTEGKFIVDREYNDELTDVVENYYIWQSVGYNNQNVFCLKVDENGDPAPGWAENGLEVCVEDGTQRQPRGIITPQGLFMLWEDYRNGDVDIYGQIVTSDGNILWQENGLPLVTQEHDQDKFKFIYDDGLYIVWQDFRSSYYPEIYLQKFDLDGNELWQEGGILVAEASDNGFENPDLVKVGNKIIVVWDNNNDYDGQNICSQLVSDDGELLWQLQGITICDEIMGQRKPIIVSNGNDDAYIAWRDGRSTIMGNEGLVSIPGIYAQKIHLEPTFADDELLKPIEILSNYPNPFNPETTISFSVTQNSDFVNLEIYNIKGQKVKTLYVILSDAQHRIEGDENDSYSVTWNGTDQNNQPVASGIYFYQLNIDDKVIASKKCLLLK